MVVKVKYVKYLTRLFTGLIRVILISSVWTVFILLNDIQRLGTYITLGVASVLALTLSMSVFRKSKSYLGEIKLDKEECEFQVYEYDHQKEIIKSKIAETRIKIWELFFPFTKYGRNYKLIIETKQGLTYKRIIEQYEIGNWDLEKFKEVIKSYGEMKEVKSSTTSFTRNNFTVSK